MPIAKLAKIKLISVKEDKEKILDALQKLAVMQIEQARDHPDPFAADTENEIKLAELKHAIRFLESFSHDKKSFLENFVSTKTVVCENDLQSGYYDFDFKEIIQKIKHFESYLTHEKATEQKIDSEIKALKPWENLTLPTQKLYNSPTLHFVAGKILSASLDNLHALLKQSKFVATLQVINQTKTESLVIILCTKENQANLDALLKGKGFTQITLPHTLIPVKEEIQKLNKLLQLSQKEVQAAQAETKKLAIHKLKLMCAYDYLLCNLEKNKAQQKSQSTTYTFILTGFIKQSLLKKLKASIAKIAPHSSVTEVAIKPDEEIPVLIENPSLLKPFEVLTKIYGLPKFSSVDPTPLLSVFYIVFFGLCLGDAGYGITLILAALWLKKKLPRGTNPSLLNLFILGGIFASIVGIFQGGYFGIELAILPAPVAAALARVKLIDPTKNPLSMLMLALALGVIQIIFGLVVNMLIKFRDKKYLDGLLDDGLWIYFIVSVILFGLSQTGKVTLFEPALTSKLALGGIIALVLTQGRKQKNLFLKFFGGILSLYSSVGYVSDILSYSRLLALGLGTTVIAIVINIIAAMTKDSAPLVGYIIMLAILFVGHLFNLAVSTLSAFIHSARLQYVEFFSKFLEGGGKEFKPFARETKYVKL